MELWPRLIRHRSSPAACNETSWISHIPLQYWRMTSGKIMLKFRLRLCSFDPNVRAAKISASYQLKRRPKLIKFRPKLLTPKKKQLLEACLKKNSGHAASNFDRNSIRFDRRLDWRQVLFSACLLTKLRARLSCFERDFYKFGRNHCHCPRQFKNLRIKIQL